MAASALSSASAGRFRPRSPRFLERRSPVISSGDPAKKVLCPLRAPESDSYPVHRHPAAVRCRRWPTPPAAKSPVGGELTVLFQFAYLFSSPASPLRSLLLFPSSFSLLPAYCGDFSWDYGGRANFLRRDRIKRSITSITGQRYPPFTVPSSLSLFLFVSAV